MEQDILDFLTYLKEKKRASANTLASYGRDLRKACAYFEKQGISEAALLNETSIRSYLLFMERERAAASSISRSLSALRTFCRYLLKMKRIDDDPTDELEAPRVEKKRPKTLGLTDADKLLAMPDVTTPKGGRDKAMLELLCATGIKVTELILLRTKDLNMVMNYIVVHEGERERVVPFGSSAKKAMLDYLGMHRNRLLDGKESEYLFVNLTGRPMSRQGFWKILKAYGKAAGIEGDLNPQILRHTVALSMMAGGADPETIRDLMGHSDLSVTMKYLR